MDEKAPTESKPKRGVLFYELRGLIIKILIIILIIFLLLTFVFGISRCPDDSMKPAIKNGDLILFYRIENRLTTKDVTMVKYEDKLLPRRVVAVGGDIVDITEDGLTVNGNLRYEDYVYTNTLPYTEGIDYPVTLAEDEVFVMADDREGAADSRLFGPVNVRDTKGKAISIIRNRSL